jgi:glycosyltransferase involved in cell wall biosynthesis
MTPIRVYTCTPVAFRGDHTFLARESGLLSRGFRSIGIDSQAVMPLPAQEGDEVGLIRASLQQLQDPFWWRRQSLNAVVFYSWAAPKYTSVAEAIIRGGAKLFVYLDTSGFWHHRSDGAAWFRAYRNFNIRTYGLLNGSARMLLGTLRHSIPAILVKPRLEHMALADVIGSGSPGALARTINYAKAFGFDHIVDRMVLSPPPIPVHFRYEGEQKKKRVICVARWLKPDWAQKNPAKLLASLALFLSRRSDYEAVVVGRGANDLRQAKFYPAALNDLRIRFINAVPNAELTTLYKESRISFCSSYHESFHLASFEAACCGCSIVALDSPDVPALQWLAKTDGSLAHRETADAFAEALCSEAQCWDQGKRDPHEISNRWTNELWSTQAAQRIINQLRL